MNFERSCFHTWLQKWAYGSGQSNCWIHKPQTDASATAVLARGLTSSHWKETDLRLPGSTTIHKRRVKPTQWNLEPKMVRNGDLMIFSVSLIKLYLKSGLFRGMRQKPSLFLLSRFELAFWSLENEKVQDRYNLFSGLLHWIGYCMRQPSANN